MPVTFLTNEDKAALDLKIGALEVELNGGAETRYYTSLANAITDLNEGLDSRKTSYASAKVKVLIPDNVASTVLLLDNVSESTEIQVSKDVNLVLNGKTLSFTNAVACLNFTTGTTCTINGEVVGSKIVKENIGSVTTTTYIIRADGASLTLTGGEYSLTGDFGAQMGMVARVGTGKYFEMNGCTANCANTNASTTKVTKCIQSQSAETIIKNCSIDAVAVRKAVGLHLATSGAKAIMENSTAKAKGSENTTATTVNAILNQANLTVKNSIVFGDAPGCHTNESTSCGIQNIGQLYCINATVNGTHSGISNGGELYVDGGSYTGFCHGGFYLSQGVDGIANINDATIRCGNYQGEFDYSGKTGDMYASMYVSSASNMAVYLDGCTIGVDGANSIAISNNSASNNTLNISNSTIVDGAGIRIDSGTGHLVNVGVGTNITAQSTGTPSQMAFTNGFYRKKHPDATCNGKDFDALLTYYATLV